MVWHATDSSNNPTGADYTSMDTACGRKKASAARHPTEAAGEIPDVQLRNAGTACVLKTRA